MHLFPCRKIFHISSKDNPSDLGTRIGVKVEDVGPDSQFYRGPDYLNLGLEEMMRKVDRSLHGTKSGGEAQASRACDVDKLEGDQEGVDIQQCRKK